MTAEKQIRLLKFYYIASGLFFLALLFGPYVIFNIDDIELLKTLISFTDSEATTTMIIFKFIFWAIITFGFQEFIAVFFHLDFFHLRKIPGQQKLFVQYFYGLTEDEANRWPYAILGFYNFLHLFTRRVFSLKYLTIILSLNALEFITGLYIAGKYFATFDDFLVPFFLLCLFILIQDIVILDRLNPGKGYWKWLRGRNTSRPK